MKRIKGRSKAITPPPNSFDLFRVNKSKAAVDISTSTLRKYFKKGLRFYKQGKCCFVSRAELAAFIQG